MLTTRSALRSSTLILSSTLLAIAAEPLPVPTTLTGVTADTFGSKANVSYGDVDGDGYNDLGTGGTIYWGSASGWDSRIKTKPSGATQLWIVPNITGAGADAKIRADVITIDGNFGGHLFQSTATRGTFSAEKLSLSLIKGRPAVGNFRGSDLADIAWIDGSGYLQVATSDGKSLTIAPSPISAGSAEYAAVAVIDWTGAQTGRLDLLLVRDSFYSSVQLFPFGATTATITQVIGNGIFQPDITVGKIHNGSDLRQDAIVTGNSSSTAIFSSGSTTSTPTTSAFAGSFRGWIVPDVTGDGIDEVAYYGLNSTADIASGGLLHGGVSIASAISAITPSADRPIPGGTNPIFGIGFHQNNQSVSRYPLAVPFKTTGSTWERHLLFVDHSGYGGTTNLMPILAPVISGTLLSHSGTGAQPMVDSSVAVQFQTPGAINAIKVTVTNAVVGDAITDLVAPANVTATDVLLNGSLTRAYSGILTPAEAKTLLDNLRFTGAAGGDQRHVTITVGGMAVSGDTSTRASAYLSNTYDASNIDVIVPPSLTFTSIANATVGTAVSCEVFGGSAPYTVSVDGGTGVSTSVSEVSTVVVTPTRTGLITVTVTDAQGLSGSFTFTASAAGVPGLVFSSVTSAKVGGTVIVEVRGGTGTYTVSMNGGHGFAGDSASVVNLFLIPTQAGEITVTVTDSAGLSGTFSFTASELPSATEPAPTVTTSVGEATVFGAICPGTVGGVRSLRAAFGSSDNRRARGFTWNSESQTYRELPTEPTGGLLPTDGVFLATRVALGLDFSGPAMPPGSTIVLRAGWNFVGMGPVQLSSNSVVRTHSLGGDFTLTNLSGQTVALSSISQAYQWSGTAYSTTATLQSGVGYWINNVATPSSTILLTRKDSDLDGRTVARAESFADNVGAPPVPPNADEQAQPESQGSCGSGSGIAVLLAGLLAFLKLGFRRK